MKIQNKSALLIAMALVLVSTSFVFAQTSATGSAKTNSSVEKRITAWQTKGAKEIDKRISSLNELATRVQSFKNVADTDKTALISTIQSIINNLATLKSQISAATSTAALAEDVKSITQTYRVYALVEPEIKIIAAADTIKTIVAQMNIVGAKIQSRLGSSTDAQVQATLADFAAKISAANTGAQQAVTQVASLKPDEGDKTVMASNTAALKSARTKIVEARKALVAARKDLQTLTKGNGFKFNPSNGTSTSAR